MDESDYAFEDETYAVIGAALEVLSQLGHGIHEKPYENALVIELGLREICCQQQTRFDVIYKTVKVGEYVPDLIAADKIIVDTKVIDRITNHQRGQTINYLRITGLPLGLIFNFRYANLQWERLALTLRKSASICGCCFSFSDVTPLSLIHSGFLIRLGPLVPSSP